MNSDDYLDIFYASEENDTLTYYENDGKTKLSILQIEIGQNHVGEKRNGTIGF